MGFEGLNGNFVAAERNSSSEVRSDHMSFFSIEQDPISNELAAFGKVCKESDLVDVLLRVKESGELNIPINDDNIKAIVYDIFSGGTETSSTTIDWTMAELMKNPRVFWFGDVDGEREHVVEVTLSPPRDEQVGKKELRLACFVRKENLE
ncbi:unnamed protein product [Fraxinus pennsylvanica]|uniref:Uncharacterized protein n=1 Tax=Fraxinus pennsylvanica TaxID=56036 RepID=A0AAD1ZLF0_9LAMI|nr:unnamed protein product [Fraxinus pennsylvanica]